MQHPYCVAAHGCGVATHTQKRSGRSAYSDAGLRFDLGLTGLISSRFLQALSNEPLLANIGVDDDDDDDDKSLPVIVSIWPCTY